MQKTTKATIQHQGAQHTQDAKTWNLENNNENTDHKDCKNQTITKFWLKQHELYFKSVQSKSKAEWIRRRRCCSKNLSMDQTELNQAFTRSQGSTEVDLNNIGCPPTGVRKKNKSGMDNLKSSSVNFIIYIQDGENTTLWDAPHIESTKKTPEGKDCYTVYINYLKGAYDTNEFLLCKETLKLYAVTISIGNGVMC